MPTIITHSVIAVSGAFGFRSAEGFLKFLLLSILCSIIPDADVIGYLWFYVPYQSFFGHRGFFHSPFFAMLFGLFIVFVFYGNVAAFSKRWWQYVLYFFILTTSHGILDALTNGGQGIALLSPFTNHRYFFPWTPLEVSPIHVEAFISRRGLTVLKNEFLWIWAPSIFILILLNSIRSLKNSK